jgi:hypothetical protein
MARGNSSPFFGGASRCASHGACIRASTLQCVRVPDLRRHRRPIRLVSDGALQRSLYNAALQPARTRLRRAAPAAGLRRRAFVSARLRRCVRAVVRRAGVRLGRVRGVLGLLPRQQAERGRPAPCRPRPSLAPLLFRLARSRRRCGRGEPSPGADVAGVRPVPPQMWHGRARSRRRCGDSPRIRMAGFFSPQGSAVVATCFCLKNCGLLPLPADWRALVPVKEYARYGECAALRATRTQTNIHTTRCVSRRRAT